MNSQVSILFVLFFNVGDHTNRLPGIFFSITWLKTKQSRPFTMPCPVTTLSPVNCNIQYLIRKLMDIICYLWVTQSGQASFLSLSYSVQVVSFDSSLNIPYRLATVSRLLHVHRNCSSYEGFKAAIKPGGGTRRSKGQGCLPSLLGVEI